MKHVLFVCTQNAGRSQMAQALFERHAPADVRAESAGQQPRREGVWPNVIEAMREIGVEIGGRRPKRLSVEMQLHADWAITLACGATCPYVPTIVEDWEIPDPAGKPLEEVRAIRDAIDMRVRDLVEQRIDAIRADRTAHQLRLQHLLPHRRRGDRRRDPGVRGASPLPAARRRGHHAGDAAADLPERRRPPRRAGPGGVDVPHRPQRDH